jgi:NAD(P)-dependent dehydrogenase (short-subunit alcohol dehydrogenase family)
VEPKQKEHGMVAHPNGKKIAFITGANKGIGFEVARQLGRRSMAVIIGARDPQQGADAARTLGGEGIDAHPVRLDVTDEHTIRAAVREVERVFGRLDVLINNAGIMLDGGMQPSTVPLDVLRRTYEINVFGPVAVLQAFLPLLKQSEAGRIVNVSSELGSLTQNTDPDFEFRHLKLLAYNSSKTALNAVTIQFAYELKDTPIKVNAADPGYTATDFNNHRGTQTVAQGARAVVWLATLPASGPTGGYFNADGPLPW